MAPKNDTPVNRVEQSVSRWRAQEQKYTQQYGNAVFNDREFMKVRATAYKTIYGQHRKQKLGFEEKLDLRVLQGQIKQMNERIYPNVYQRAGMGQLKFLSRPALAVLKFGANTLSYLVTGRPFFKTGKAASKSQAVVRNLKGALPVNNPSTYLKPPVVDQRRASRPRVLTEQNGPSKRM